MTAHNVVVRCRVCGGANVQCMDWTYPNTGTIANAWNASASSGETWCDDCEDHTVLVWYTAARKLEQLAAACGFGDGEAFLESHEGDEAAPGICIGDDCDVIAAAVSDPQTCEACGWSTIVSATAL